jgi:hypothetical protein
MNRIWAVMAALAAHAIARDVTPVDRDLRVDGSLTGHWLEAANHSITQGRSSASDLGDPTRAK